VRPPATLRSFGYEWTTFATVQPEDEAFWRRYTELLPLDELHDAVALDAGCGNGRFSLLTSRHVGALVALDGSDAVHVAARNLAGEARVLVVRGDLRAVPVADASVDLVTCLGVVHHLDDPRAGFDALARLVAPGGRFPAVRLQPPRQAGVSAAWAAPVPPALRRLTVRCPIRLPARRRRAHRHGAVRRLRAARCPGGEARLAPARGPAAGHLPRGAVAEPVAGHLRPAERTGRAPLHPR
jgi:SAM-dependent methyltransferase